MTQEEIREEMITDLYNQGSQYAVKKYGMTALLHYDVFAKLNFSGAFTIPVEEDVEIYNIKGIYIGKLIEGFCNGNMLVSRLSSVPKGNGRYTTGEEYSLIKSNLQVILPYGHFYSYKKDENQDYVLYPLHCEEGVKILSDGEIENQINQDI